MQKKILAGIDIGGTKTAVVISAEPPTVLGRIEFPTRPSKGWQPAIASIKKAVDDLLTAQGLDRTALLRLGVSCGGPLDRIQGIIQSPPNLPTPAHTHPSRLPNWICTHCASALLPIAVYVCPLNTDPLRAAPAVGAVRTNALFAVIVIFNITPGVVDESAAAEGAGADGESGADGAADPANTGTALRSPFTSPSADQIQPISSS